MIDHGMSLINDTLHIHIPDALEVNKVIYNGVEFVSGAQWIPCSERLPEEDHWLGGSGKQFSDNVLVSIYNSDDEDWWVDVSQTIDGEWIIEIPRHCEIVAWMPLPNPYKEEEDGCVHQ